MGPGRDRALQGTPRLFPRGRPPGCGSVMGRRRRTDPGRGRRSAQRTEETPDMTWTKRRPATARTAPARTALAVRVAVSAADVRGVRSAARGLLVLAELRPSAQAKPAASASAISGPRAWTPTASAWRSTASRWRPGRAAADIPTARAGPAAPPGGPAGEAAASAASGAGRPPTRPSAGRAGLCEPAPAVQRKRPGRGRQHRDEGVHQLPQGPRGRSALGVPGRRRDARGLNTSDPKSAQAFALCKALLPQRRSGAPSPSASPSA